MTKNKKPLIQKAAKIVQLIEKNKPFSKKQIVDKMGLPSIKSLDYPFSIFVSRQWIRSRRSKKNKIKYFRVRDIDFDALEYRNKNRKKMNKTSVTSKTDPWYRFVYNVELAK